MPVRVVYPDRATTVPLILDSPHSGNVYPDDFRPGMEMRQLRRAEDAHVDELFGDAPTHGAVLIAANFPRSYIDPNRRDTDVDPAKLEGVWSRAAEPGARSARGTGLIWTEMHGKYPIYDRQLTANEIGARVDSCWQPYHNALAEAFQKTHTTFGRAYHINCHSMRSMGNDRDKDGAVQRPDFVISDREGTTCDRGFVDLVVGVLKKLGYDDVRINDPMQGADLIRRYSDPANNRHSLQIEINRRHYMDEASFGKSDNFTTLQGHMSRVIAAAAEYAAAAT